MISFNYDWFERISSKPNRLAERLKFMRRIRIFIAFVAVKYEDFKWRRSSERFVRLNRQYASLSEVIRGNDPDGYTEGFSGRRRALSARLRLNLLKEGFDLNAPIDQKV